MRLGRALLIFIVDDAIFGSQTNVCRAESLVFHGVNRVTVNGGEEKKKCKQ